MTRYSKTKTCNRLRSQTRRRRQLICETLEDRRLLAVIFSEGFDTATNYTTSGVGAASNGDYFSRVTSAGATLDGAGAGTVISLDGTQASYGGFSGNYFAIEDADAVPGATSGKRTIDFGSISTSGFENLSFSIDVAAGDSGSTSDGNPASDDDHFLAVIYSTDGGSNWIPGAIINVVGPTSDTTNKDFAVVNPPTFTGGGSLTALGNSIEANEAINSGHNTAPLSPYDQFNNAPTTVTLNANAQNVNFSIANAPSVQLKLVMNSDDTHVELAFDSLSLSGDPLVGNVAPSVSASSAANVTEANIGDTSYSFTVTYTDDVAIDVSDIDINDVSVTGPGGPVPITNASVNIGTDGTPRTATYTITPPGGSWNAADNGAYSIDMVANEVSDTDGTPLFVSPGAITSFNVNATNTAPTVFDVLAEDVIFQDLGDTSYSFTVTYSDTFHDIDVSTIDINDVTVSKGGGGTLTVTGVTTSPAINFPVVTATYTVTPPGGSWDAGDDDTYTIALNAGQVDDTLGGSVAANASLATFVVNSNKVLNEGFETDGNGTRYTTTSQFSGGVNDYFTRVFDGNGNTAGGESPAIDLDDATLDEYIDFERRVYFAAEDVDNSGAFAGFRVLDINPINTGAFTGLTFMGDFGAGDNTDGGPSYDGDHFMAVLVSTDGGATYIPKMVFRADVVAGDNTNFVARQVTTIAPGTDPTSDTLAELGAKMSAGQIMGSAATGLENAFDFMAAEGDGSGANGLLLGANLQTASVGLDDATETRVRLVVQADDNNVEWAFDNLMITGTFVGGNQAPIAQSAVANDVGEPEIGDTSYSFTVTYADDSAIDFTTIDTSDVTVTGPGGAISIDTASVNIASNGTPRTATYSFTPPGGSWDSADNGLYTIGIVGNEVGDDDGTQLFVAADANFATFNVNATNTDPVVSNSLAEDVIFTDLGETSYSFTIQYSDVGGVDVSSIDISDVSVIGPGGPLTVTSAVEASGTDGSPKTATYTVTPPGGSWDAGDAGVYNIDINAGEVLDILGASVAAGAVTSFNVIPGKLLNETFETDGNGTRYTTAGEFSTNANGYFTRVTDLNGNTAGGETPEIDLDDDTLDEYIDFQGQTYFAAEDFNAGGGGANFRVVDIDPVDTSLFTNLQFMGLFAAGDTDANPTYDGDHFMAVLTSTDGGATYIPQLIFRADVTAADSTNFAARQVSVITPGTDPASDTLAELGAKLSAGQIMPGVPLGGADGQFDFLAADTGGTGATGTTLGANFQAFSIGLPDAAETRIRLVLNADDVNVEWAFDSLMVTGDVADNTPPTLLSFERNTPVTNPTNADSLTFRATFDEAVVNVGTDDFVANGSTALVTTVSQVNASTYDVTISGGDLAGLNGLVGLDLSLAQDIEDQAGNALPGGEPAIDEDYLVDNIAPTVTSITRQNPATSPTNADSLVFRVTYSEPLAAISPGDLMVTGTTAIINGINLVNSSTIDYFVSGGDLAGLNGTVGLDVAAVPTFTADPAGNLLATGEPAIDETYEVDNTAPTLLSFERFNPPTSPTNADVLVFRATFDEDVVNVDSGDFAVNSASTAIVSAVNPVSGSVYDVTVSGGDLAGFNGTVGLDLDGGQDIEDLAGNLLPPGEPAIDETYDVVNIAAAPEFLVNDSTGGFQVTYAETRNVAANAAGDMVIVFAGSGPGDSDGIFARRFDANNTPLGSAFLVNVTTSGNQRYPSVAVGPGGESVVAWSGKVIGDNDGGVGIRLYDNNGVSISGEIRISQTIPSDQHRPVVAKAPNGDFIVVWSGKGVGDTSGGVFARRFAANGVPLTGEFLVNTTTSVTQHEPDVAIASDGSFVIAWSGNGPGDASGVFFQRFNSSGSPVGSETRINTTISGQQKLPSVGIDGANNFTIVWSGRGSGDSSGVFLQRYNASGSPVGGEELVNTTTLYDQEDASISVPPSGAAVVTWTSLYQDGSQRGVYAQEYSAAGAKVGGEININSTSTSDQKFSSVAVRGESSYTVVWSGRGVGDTTGVFAATRQRMPVPLVAATATTNEPISTLADADIGPVVAEAKAHWIATGLSDSEIAILNAVAVHIVDMDAGILGGNLGTSVYLDLDAAGHGWYVDATPGDDSEFAGLTALGDGNDAVSRMDLLTVIMHELGHAIGRDHADDDDLMGASLPVGTRRLPSSDPLPVKTLVVPLRPVIDPTPSTVSNEDRYDDVERVDLQNADDYQVLIPPTPRVDVAVVPPELEDYYANMEEEQAGDQLDDDLLSLLAG